MRQGLEQRGAVTGAGSAGEETEGYRTAEGPFGAQKAKKTARLIKSDGLQSAFYKKLFVFYCSFWYRYFLFEKSAVQTACTNFKRECCSIDNCLYWVEVWSPCSACVVVRFRNFVTTHYAFTANITSSRHNIYLP